MNPNYSNVTPLNADGSIDHRVGDVGAKAAALAALGISPLHGTQVPVQVNPNIQQSSNSQEEVRY